MRPLTWALVGAAGVVAYMWWKNRQAQQAAAAQAAAKATIPNPAGVVTSSLAAPTSSTLPAQYFPPGYKFPSGTLTMPPLGAGWQTVAPTAPPAATQSLVQQIVAARSRAYYGGGVPGMIT